MEEVKEKLSNTDADEEIELSEEDEIKEDYTQRRLVLMNLKNMIVSASAEAKEQVKSSEQLDNVPNVNNVTIEEKSVQCSLCFSSLSCLSNVSMTL